MATRVIILTILTLLTLSGQEGLQQSRGAYISLSADSTTSTFRFDTVYGLDVSHYQGRINWHRIPTVFKFVCLKATEGYGLLDPHFHRNWESAKQTGMIRGAYHFYRPLSSPLAQFRFFVSHVRLDSSDLPPVIDLEAHPRNTLVFQRHLLIFLTLIEHHYGVKPIIYTNRSFYRHHLSGSVFDPGRYVYWIADYRSHSLDSVFPQWSFWQYSPKGRIDGISGHTDLNYYRYGLDSLRKLCLH